MPLEDQDYCAKCLADRISPPRRIAAPRHPELRIGLYNCEELCVEHIRELKALLRRRQEAEALRQANASTDLGLDPAIMMARERARAAAAVDAGPRLADMVDTEDGTIDEYEALSRLSSNERRAIMRQRRGLSPSISG